MNESLVTNNTIPVSAKTNETGNELYDPKALRIFRVTLFTICTLASLLGNAVLCKAVRDIPSRKSYSYYLVTNLAVAEIISSVTLPFAYVYSELHRWPFGEFACSYLIPLQNVAMIVVTFTLAVIAVYRHMFLVKSRYLLNSWIALTVIVLSLWFAALLISVPLFLKAKVVPGHCVFHVWSGYKLYSLVKFTLSFGVPYLVMLVAYGSVASKVKHHMIQRKRSQMSSHDESANTDVIAMENDEKFRRRRIRAESRGSNNRATNEQENDLLRMINAIILVFVVCYIPYQIVFLLSHTGNQKNIPDELYVFSLVLTNLSGAIHPLLYGTMNKFYAKAFSRLVMCKH